MDNEKLRRFGAYIKLLREAEGLSQEELAKKSGFSGRAAISAIEKGKNNISVERLPDLAKALHTTPGNLMDVLVEDEVKLDYRTDYLVKTNKTALLIETLTPAEQDQVDTYIKFLINLRGGNKDE